MEPTMLGIIGGIVGMAIGLAGGALGCWVTYKVHGRNEAQRAYLQRSYAALLVATPVYIIVVWLYSLRVLPAWAYTAGVVGWVVGVVTLSVHMSLRLEALSDAAGPDGNGTLRAAALPANVRRLVIRVLSGIGALVALFVLAIALTVAELIPLWSLAITVPAYLAGLAALILSTVRYARRLGAGASAGR
jgi:hypothetical protein